MTQYSVKRLDKCDIKWNIESVRSIYILSSQNVGFISPASYPLNDNIPTVVTPGTGHDGGQDAVGSKHLSFLCQFPDDRVVGCRDVVEETVSHG